MTLFFFSCSHNYPRHWWEPVKNEELQWWEVSPHTAKNCEVVISKRNELGILSNFANTPFILDGKKYPSVEALWQSMKYPESSQDERLKWGKWPYKRSEVEVMKSGFKAKEAGELATQIMRKNHANWVSYRGKKMIYKTPKRGEHYKLIVRAMKAKLEQNPQVREVLIKTGKLSLIPDHYTTEEDPPAWKYNKIWMEIREELKK